MSGYNLLEDSVKHCEQLQVLSGMRSRKRNHMRKEDERVAKVYKDYDWADLIQSGTLHKLTVKELDKYKDCHHLQRKYFSKKDKKYSL